jgi:aminoethylphosphonate catabolism LysR family transcriptional regulator
VATHGSFTRASEMLNITQPTLSGQVKELEERYGTKLFIRHGRRIELTDIGKSAFSITRLIFRHEEEVEHLLQSARALTSGQLRVGADSPYIATPLLAQFQRLYPGIQISIQYGNSQQLMAWIVSRSCDVAFMPNIPQEDERVFVNQDHDWAERRSVTIEELVTQRIVLREKGSRTRSIFEEAVSRAGHLLPDVMEISGREGVREAVAAGFGGGIVAENELVADSRLRALPVSNAELVHAEYVVCLQEMRSLRVNDAFLEMVSASQKDSS